MQIHSKLFMLGLVAALYACSDTKPNHSSKNGASDTTSTTQGLDMTIDLNHKTNDERFVIAIQTIVQVLTQKVTLEQATPILGAGQYHYPKSPKQPIREYYLRADGVYQVRPDGETYDVVSDPNKLYHWSAWFERFNEETPFHKVDFSMSDLKLSKRLLTENLKWKFLKKMTLEEMSLEELITLYGDDYARNNPEYTRERLMESLGGMYAGYHYTSQENGQTFRYIIYTSKENYNPAEKEFPTKHSKIVIINESEAQMGIQGIEKRSSRVGQICPQTGFWTTDVYGGAQGIFLRKGDKMPGHSFSKAEQEAMVWRLVKLVDVSAIDNT
jgi:hypothetical protein